jgi:hypothetical protein
MEALLDEPVQPGTRPPRCSTNRHSADYRPRDLRRGHDRPAPFRARRAPGFAWRFVGIARPDGADPRAIWSGSYVQGQNFARQHGSRSHRPGPFASSSRLWSRPHRLHGGGTRHPSLHYGDTAVARCAVSVFGDGSVTNLALRVTDGLDGRGCQNSPREPRPPCSSRTRDASPDTRRPALASGERPSPLSIFLAMSRCERAGRSPYGDGSALQTAGAESVRLYARRNASGGESRRAERAADRAITSVRAALGVPESRRPRRATTQVFYRDPKPGVLPRCPTRSTFNVFARGGDRLVSTEPEQILNTTRRAHRLPDRGRVSRESLGSALAPY